MTRPREILDFWFAQAHRPRWWKRDDAFDAAIRERFAQTAENAAAGRYDDWIVAPESALALVIALDQFPRNLHRGSPRTWAQDAKARAVTVEALARGHDAAFEDRDMKLFLYMPLMHSEDPEDQARCLRLLLERIPGHEEAIRSARDHKAVIDRFGRFPHRNEILGRPNTPEEEAYLSDPNAGW
jgi:uncharacterized protein (DUF924 family)